MVVYLLLMLLAFRFSGYAVWVFACLWLIVGLIVAILVVFVFAICYLGLLDVHLHGFCDLYLIAWDLGFAYGFIVCVCDCMILWYCLYFVCYSFDFTFAVFCCNCLWYDLLRTSCLCYVADYLTVDLLFCWMVFGLFAGVVGVYAADLILCWLLSIWLAVVGSYDCVWLCLWNFADALWCSCLLVCLISYYLAVGFEFGVFTAEETLFWFVCL